MHPRPYDLPALESVSGFETTSFQSVRKLALALSAAADLWRSSFPGTPTQDVWDLIKDDGPFGGWLGEELQRSSEVGHFCISESRSISWLLEVTLEELARDCHVGSLEKLANDQETTLDDFADPLPDFRSQFRLATPMWSVSLREFGDALNRSGFRPATLRELLHMLKADPRLADHHRVILAYGSVSLGRRAKKISCLLQRQTGPSLSCRFVDTVLAAGTDWVAVTEANRTAPSS